MSSVRSLGRLMLPAPVRRRLRAAQRALTFRRAMRRFLKDPEACAQPGSPVLADLVAGWGNRGFSAKDEYLADCIRHALAAKGPILECGSGLSTILVGVVATRRRLHHWALEHAAEWAARTGRYLRRYELDVALCVAPLDDHGAFWWYDAPLQSMPERFALVVCDGPPGQTKGGRYGLVPIMRQRLEQGCVILLDDAGREEELAIARRWEGELGASLRILGATKPHIEMIVGGSRTT
jgi:hypothetical protein